MPKNTDPQKLISRKWVHSHEESQVNRIVFRPSEYGFPPSRGRGSFTLEDNGLVEIGYPGPTDRSSSAEGRWVLEGNMLTILGPMWSGDYEVESVDEQILLLIRL